MVYSAKAGCGSAPLYFMILYSGETLFEFEEMPLIPFIRKGCDPTTDDNAKDGVEDLIIEDAVVRSMSEEEHQDQLGDDGMEDIDAIGILAQEAKHGSFQVDHKVAGGGGHDQVGEEDGGEIGEEPGVHPNGLWKNMGDKKKGKGRYHSLDGLIFYEPLDPCVERFVEIDPGGQGAQPEIVEPAERKKVEGVEMVELPV
jgi:hypothetical protein